MKVYYENVLTPKWEQHLSNFTQFFCSTQSPFSTAQNSDYSSSHSTSTTCFQNHQLSAMFWDYGPHLHFADRTGLDLSPQDAKRKDRITLLNTKAVANALQAHGPSQLQHQSHPRQTLSYTYFYAWKRHKTWYYTTIIHSGACTDFIWRLKYIRSVVTLTVPA